MTTVQLNSGYTFPAIGLGTWQAKPGEVGAAVVSAIEAGYRHIDCAFIYGNEKEIGEGFRKVFSSGIVKREELFITSKLWNTRHDPENVMPSLKESLENLGLEYLDLYLIHWPISFKGGNELFPKDEQGNLIYGNVHYLDTWKTMEECVKEGLVKSIGLSNFNHTQIQDVFDNGTIKPSVLQVEVSPYFQQEKLVKFCQGLGIVVTAFSSFGASVRLWTGTSEASLLDDPTLVSIAQKHGKTSAHVVLRWLFQRKIVVIPKSVTPSRIQGNLQIFDFTLSDDEMESIRTLDKNMRQMMPVVERNGRKEARDKDAPFFPWLNPESF